MNTDKVRYEVDLRDTAGHRIVVVAEISVVAPLPDGSAEVGLPSWTPGSYMIRDYARHVTNFKVIGGEGVKVAKDRWRVQVPPSRRIKISYEAFAYERSVRTNWLSDSHAFIAPAALFIDETSAFSGRGARVSRPCEVTFKLPKGWAADGLVAHRSNKWIAPSYAALVDSAFLAGKLRKIEFRAARVAHQLVAAGDDASMLDLKAIAHDAKAAIESSASLFGGVPYKNFKFLAYTAPQSEGMGGLEHRDGCALQISANATATTEKRLALAGLVAHEHFHAWNVKRLADQALVEPDLSVETHTSLLWFHEGFTSYYDDLVLVRSGVMPRASYLNLIADLQNLLATHRGPLSQSLYESSLDSWIKFYKKNDEWRSASVSYYQQGALAALALDLEARVAGRGSVDALMRALWARHKLGFPLTETTWLETAIPIFGDLALRWHADWISGAKHSNVAKLLKPFGVDAKPKDSNSHRRGWLGIVTRLDGTRCFVEEALAHGPGRAVGISPRDEIIAVSGRRVSGDLEAALAAFTPGAKIPVTVFRGERLLTFEVTLTSHPAPPVQLTLRSRQTAREKVLLDAWLGTAG